MSWFKVAYQRCYNIIFNVWWEHLEKFEMNKINMEYQKTHLNVYNIVLFHFGFFESLQKTFNDIFMGMFLIHHYIIL